MKQQRCARGGCSGIVESSLKALFLVLVRELPIIERTFIILSLCSHAPHREDTLELFYRIAIPRGMFVATSPNTTYSLVGNPALDS